MQVPQFFTQGACPRAIWFRRHFRDVCMRAATRTDQPRKRNTTLCLVRGRSDCGDSIDSNRFHQRYPCAGCTPRSQHYFLNDLLPIVIGRSIACPSRQRYFQEEILSRIQNKEIRGFPINQRMDCLAMQARTGGALQLASMISPLYDSAANKERIVTALSFSRMPECCLVRRIINCEWWINRHRQ